MKKSGLIVALALCVFVVGICTPSYGAEENMLTKEKALQLGKQAARDYFGINVNDQKYQLNVENRRDWSDSQRYVWSMSWRYDDATEYLSVYIVLDSSTGEILEINKEQQEYGSQSQMPAQLTKEEAREKAEAYINKILPDKFKETQLAYDENSYRHMRSSYPIVYDFRYVRLIGGVKYEGNQIAVGIDGATGQLRNFYYRWDIVNSLPKPEGIKSQDEAANVFRDKMDMEQIYLPIQDETKPYYKIKDTKLVYRANYNFDMVDAKTGNTVDWAGKPQASQKSKELSKDRIQAIKKQAKLITKLDREMTREKAEATALSILKDEFKGKFKINEINYMEGDKSWEANGRKTWNIAFTVQKENTDKNENNGRIVIDALTGQVIALNNWSDYEAYKPQPGVKPDFTWEQAYDKAIELVAKYHPDKIDQLRLKQIKPEMNQPQPDGSIYYPTEYYFNFTRDIDGALYEENQIDVSINSRTNGLLHFNCRWAEDLKLPPKADTISKEKAKDIIFRYNAPELVYNRFIISGDSSDTKTETKLVYKMAPTQAEANMHMLIDALNGNLLDYQGKSLNINGMSKFENNIKGHWVEKEARILAQQGILDKNDFVPDREITKIEAIKMLVESKGMHYYYPIMVKGMGSATGEQATDDEKVEYTDITEDSEEYPYVQKAIRFGIIPNSKEPLKKEEKLSREELAVMLVKTLGYDKLAQANHIFRINFSDKDKISDEFIGHIAICEGLGLIRGGDTAFRPNDKITMAETASMIYKSLQYFNR